MNEKHSVLEALLKQMTLIVADHEKRIRWLEKGALMALGAGLVIKYLIK